MDSKEFRQIRTYLGKTQAQLAQLLCVSTKAVQSFEQGWRKIPATVERQLLTVLALQNDSDGSTSPCWDICNCPDEWREKCIVWQYNVKRFCWLINGTHCKGVTQGSWDKKIKMCRQCQVFKSMIPSIN